MYDKKCFLTETFTKIENVSVNVDDKNRPNVVIVLSLTKRGQHGQNCHYFPANMYYIKLIIVILL